MSTGVSYPTIKIADTDLYGRGRSVKGSKLRDHTKPNRGNDFLSVEKGKEYYEWKDEEGNITGFEDKYSNDSFMKPATIDETPV